MGDCLIYSLAVASYPLPVEERLQHARLALRPAGWGSLLLDAVREVLIVGLKQWRIRVHALVLAKRHFRALPSARRCGKVWRSWTGEMLYCLAPTVKERCTCSWKEKKAPVHSSVCEYALVPRSCSA